MSRHTRYNKARYAGSNFSNTRAAADYYSYTSSALKIEQKYDVKSAGYLRNLERSEKTKSVKSRLAKAFLCVVICLCAITMVFARSMVYNYQLENDKFVAALEAEKKETETIVALNTEKVNLSTVEQVATTRLNMAKPQSYQIVYIEVPKSDYTVLHESQLIEEKDHKAVASMKDVFENIKSSKDLLTLKTTTAEPVEDIVEESAAE